MTAVNFLKANLLNLCFAAVALVVIGNELLAPTPSYHMFQFAQPVNKSGFGPSESVTFAGLDFRVVALWVFNYLLTAFLGLRIVTQIPYFRGQSRVLAGAAGFFLGYLAVTALARVASVVVPIPHDDYLTVIAILACAYGLRGSGAPEKATEKSAVFTILGFAVAVFVLALLQQIFFGDFRWVGHGHNQYAMYMKQWEREGLFFPIFDQHYDEFVFHHFLSGLFLEQKFNALVPWWVTLALNKASVFVFFTLAARAFGLPLWDALLTVVFVFIGTLSLFPGRYDLLFDSANPLFYVVHSGRLVGAPAILFFVFLWRAKDIGPLAGFLVAAGLTATTISNALWLIVLLLVMGLYGDSVKRRAQSLWSLALCPTLYAFASLGWLVWVKLCVLGVHFFASSWIREIPRSLKAYKAAMWVPAFLAIGVFCLIFGNVAAMNPLGILVREYTAFLSLPPDVFSLAPAEAKSLLDPLIGDHREIELYSLYSVSFYTYVLLYGGLLLLAALALRSRAKLGEPEDRVFAALTFALPFVFFFVDFVGVGTRAWVRTRFLEVPVCLITFFAILLLYKSGKKANWLRAYLAAFAVFPFLLTERPRQIWENLMLLLSLG